MQTIAFYFISEAKMNENAVFLGSFHCFTISLQCTESRLAQSRHYGFTLSIALINQPRFMSGPFSRIESVLRIDSRAETDPNG
jgi:hypothetical protein